MQSTPSKETIQGHLSAIVAKIKELDALCDEADLAGVEVGGMFLMSWPFSRTSNMKKYIEEYFTREGWDIPWHI